MSGKREFREVAITEIRADDESGKIMGYAAVFDQEAPIWDFSEVIRPGAFAKTIADRADVFAFWNHESGKILGRTKNDTLTLTEDSHGLHVDISPPNTPTADEARTLIRDGFVDKMSFGFEVIKDTWTDRGKDELPLREIQEARLFEVSPVPLPAYVGTSVAARGLGYKPEIPKPPEPEPEPVLHSTLLAQLRKRALLLRRREIENVASTV